VHIEDAEPDVVPYIPAMQSLHVVEAAAAENFPALHPVQETDVMAPVSEA